MHSEYGGYLPFEIEIGGDYFTKYGSDSVLRTNSAKAALYFALKGLGIRKLYAPHYMCASMNAMFEDSGVETAFYFLNDDLLPELSGVTDGAAVLLVNYFGVMDEAVRAAAERFPLVFLDQSHAFFAEPLLRDGAYSIYSCRKFFGVPDGGYLVGRNAGALTGDAAITGAPTAGTLDTGAAGSARGETPPDAAETIPRDLVSGHFSYLVTSLEHGTNAAYHERQASDLYFRGNYKGMSTISRSLLSAVNYERQKELRLENFRALHRRLAAANRLRLPAGGAPAYVYPFWPKVDKLGSALKKALVAEKIYVPTMWRELLAPPYEGTIEAALSDEAVFLPVDQRYGAEDMDYLAERTFCLLEGT